VGRERRKYTFERDAAGCLEDHELIASKSLDQEWSEGGRVRRGE
jgi:hypothetical protein